MKSRVRFQSIAYFASQPASTAERHEDDSSGNNRYKVQVQAFALALALALAQARAQART
jgi:hypothetical protein